ncbi:MAG: hypothetical protein R2879_20750, partial [Saprospiraceae bacterium]
MTNPTFKKFGGGSRVKTVSVSDEWNITNGGGSRSYGQSYDYTIPYILNGDTIQISSGVASYEPFIGGDENSFKEPFPYVKEEIFLAPDNFYYSEKPIGESLFPSPIIGYSQVKVTTLNNNIERTGTGYSINQFYTAKDFPIFTEQTNLSIGTKRVKTGNPIISFLKLGIKDHVTASQGFLIETNDMHGKMKTESVYNQFGSLISSTHYKYREKQGRNGKTQISNDINVVAKNGEIFQNKKGIQMDIWNEMKQDNTTTKTIGAAINVDGFFLTFIPAFIPSGYPSIQQESTMLRTSITTKFIKRTGLLEKVIVTENGSTIETENLLYDKETGDVLLTRTQNEFEDDIYQMNLPAHWAYDGMESAYKNIGVTFKFLKISDGKFPATFDPEPFFFPGDEVYIENSVEKKGFIVKDEVNDQLIIIDKDGNALGKSPALINPTIKIVRSGKRNMASSPIANIVSKKIPINDSKISFENVDVISSDALEYSDDWEMYCEKYPDTTGQYTISESPINPYRTGLKGNWMKSESFAFYNPRTPNSVQTSNIRLDGTITDFYSYWDSPTSPDN